MVPQCSESFSPPFWPCMLYSACCWVRNVCSEASRFLGWRKASVNASVSLFCEMFLTSTCVCQPLRCGLDWGKVLFTVWDVGFNVKSCIRKEKSEKTCRLFFFFFFLPTAQFHIEEQQKPETSLSILIGFCSLSIPGVNTASVTC